MSSKEASPGAKIKKFLESHEKKIVLAVGLVLVAVLSFEAGLLKGQKWQQDPLVIEKPVAGVIAGAESCAIAPADSGTPAATSVQASAPVQTQPASTKGACNFVVSKNSNKIHPTVNCTWADRIKPENKLCFSTLEEAKAKGYIEGSCIK